MSKIAKLIIRDEVNVKFEGLDVITRRKISDKLKFFLPYAFHLPAYKLGRWDGNIRFCDIGGRTYLNLLDRILQLLKNKIMKLKLKIIEKYMNLSLNKLMKVYTLKKLGDPSIHGRAAQLC